MMEALYFAGFRSDGCTAEGMLNYVVPSRGLSCIWYTYCPIAVLVATIYSTPFGTYFIPFGPPLELDSHGSLFSRECQINPKYSSYALGISVDHLWAKLSWRM